MSGTSVYLYNNFAEAQGPLYVNGPQDVINDAQAFRTYSSVALAGGGRGKKITVSGGSEIRFSWFAKTGEVTRHVQPGETRTWSQPQNQMHGRIALRYRETHLAWTRQVIMANEGWRSGDPAKMFHAFIDHRWQLEQQMATDYWNFDERHIWSEPDFSEQESLVGGTQGQFYPIAAFINEYTNGLYNNSGTAGTAWTTIEGIDPSTTTKGQDQFKHPVVGYSNEMTSSNSPFSNSNIFTALSKAWRKTHFEKPPKMGEYFSDPAYNNQQIFTSEVGQQAYEIALRASQDLLVVQGRQDAAITDPTYNFIPVKYVEALTSATLYPAGVAATITNNVAESSSGCLYGGGPRFYFINSEYMYPVYDEDMFFERGKVREHFNDPDTFVQPLFIWGNLLCTSRKRHCLVRPARATGTVLYSALYS